MKTLPSFTGDGSITEADSLRAEHHLPNTVVIDGVGMRISRETLEELFETEPSATYFGVPVHSIIEAIDNPKPDFSEINELVSYVHNKSTIEGYWESGDTESFFLRIIRRVAAASDEENPQEPLSIALHELLDLAGYLGCDLAQGLTEALNNQSK